MEPFKNQFSPPAIRMMAEHLAGSFSEFPVEAFVTRAATGLDALELKDRVRHIGRALADLLPTAWGDAAPIIVGALGDEVDPEHAGSGVMDGSGVRGFMTMVLGHTVVLRGLHDPIRSLDVLKELTKRFTAEFAIRPFIREHPELVGAVFDTWIEDASAHVRRLVTEGTRPRLPWSFRLRAYETAPERTAHWLTALVDDPSLYVRRSVANHLGDIGKDRPEYAVQLARSWLEHPSAARTWVVTHGLRYLSKKGHRGALEVLGYDSPKIGVELFLDVSALAIGQVLNLGCHIISSSDRTQSLLIDYIVWHVRANGTRTPKVFRWCKKMLHAGERLELSKTHSFKPVSTRRYYGGTHRVEMQVNGQVFGGVEFELNEG